MVHGLTLPLSPQVLLSAMVLTPKDTRLVRGRGDLIPDNKRGNMSPSLFSK